MDTTKKVLAALLAVPVTQVLLAVVLLGSLAACGGGGLAGTDDETLAGTCYIDSKPVEAAQCSKRR